MTDNKTSQARSIQEWIDTIDWQLLGYSTPFQIQSQLHTGETVEIAQHHLSFDKKNQLLFVTNAAGVRSVLRSSVDLDVVGDLMLKLAAGRTIVFPALG